MHAARTPRARILGIFGAVIGFCGLIACLAGQPPLYARLFALLIPPPAYVGDLTYGEAESGALNDGSGVAYTFEARNGDVITVSVDLVDTRIEIVDPVGMVLATANKTLYAALLPSDGTYTLVLSGPAGDFNVRIDNQDTLPRRSLIFGTPVQDRYVGGVGQFWTFVARNGDRLFVDITAQGFAPTLVLIEPDGTLHDTATWPDTNLGWSLTLPEAGDYLLVIGSGDGGTGTYDLRITR